MRRTNWIEKLLPAVLAAAPIWAQGYPPQQQQQQYPPQYQQQPDYNQQQPYYGQQPNYGAQAPIYAPQQLDQLVQRIALYPDPLLAQILTASTYSNVIPDAAGWARGHAGYNGDALARNIREDSLPWDPSVISLLPFPTVLDLMSGDMGWTQQLGSAVLANRAAVMDAVQRQRQLAQSYGYLRDSEQLRIVNGGPGDIEILPAQQGLIYVPYYNPYVVYSRPRPGFFVGGAISFGPRIGIASFAPWGWGGSSFRWNEHRIIVNNRPWERTWVNREAYAHPYAVERPEIRDRRVERHDLQEYRGAERRDDRREVDRRERERHEGGDRREGDHRPPK